jgi:hypothetical protein
VKDQGEISDGLKTTRKTTGLLNGNERGQGFKPGQSGNPGGRPKGLASLVQSATRDGADLVSIMTRIATGKLLVNKRPPSHRDRIAAIEWLADRGFGKCSLNLNHSERNHEEIEARDANIGDLVAELARRGKHLPTCFKFEAAGQTTGGVV